MFFSSLYKFTEITKLFWWLVICNLPRKRQGISKGPIQWVGRVDFLIRDKTDKCCQFLMNAKFIISFCPTKYYVSGTKKTCLAYKLVCLLQLFTCQWKTRQISSMRMLHLRKSPSVQWPFIFLRAKNVVWCLGGFELISKLC